MQVISNDCENDRERSGVYQIGMTPLFSIIFFKNQKTETKL